MAKKEQKASDRLNLALSSIDSALSIMSGMVKDNQQVAPLVTSAREQCDIALDALIAIRFHLSQI